MKRYNVLVIVIVLATVLMTGCKDGDRQDTIQEGTVKYELILNNGSCFVYIFEDPETGVWYISTGEGITPRLDKNGEPYRPEKGAEEWRD